MVFRVYAIVARTSSFGDAPSHHRGAVGPSLSLAPSLGESLDVCACHTYIYFEARHFRTASDNV